ncbi:MAG: hypothetical protein KBG42_01395 [Lachnospiraceae bacterium]|nr:hypothetical protein [Lachnospiraceae bacterium]
MTRILYSDLHRILKGRAIKAGMAMIFGYTLILTLFLKVVLYSIDATLTSDDVLTSFPTASPFFIAASVLYLFLGDFSDGTIRNKIMCGVQKKTVAASAIILGSLTSVFFIIFSQVSGLLLAGIFADGYVTMTTSEIGEFCIRNIMASAAAGSFMTMILMAFGGTKLSYVAGLVITFFFRVATAEVLDKLYPENGACLLEGTKLKLYMLYDRYCPYAFFTGINYHDLTKCLIGCIILTVFSLLAGMIVYEKREFK